MTQAFPLTTQERAQLAALNAAIAAAKLKIYEATQEAEHAENRFRGAAALVVGIRGLSTATLAPDLTTVIADVPDRPKDS